MMKYNILIAEEDKLFIDSMRYSLENNNCNIYVVENYKSILEKLKEKEYNIIIMNVKIEGIKSFEICKAIRKVSTVPIIAISERADDILKIMAFEYGVDDYLVKPFNILELKARIKSIFRRIEYSKAEIKKETKKHILNVQGIKINTLKRKILVKGREISLTGKEFDLFYILSTSPGKIFTREELLNSVWGYEYYGDLRTVDVHIRRIREKIEKNLKDTKYIMTKWGVGYYFNYSS